LCQWRAAILAVPLASLCQWRTAILAVPLASSCGTTAETAALQGSVRQDRSLKSRPSFSH